jgi:DNA ligase (NAD+)
MKITTQTAKFDALRDLGFSTPRYGTVSVADLPAFYERMKGERDSLDFDVDGIVASAVDLATIEDLGFVSNGARRCLKAQIAIKYPAETQVVRIKDIFWSTDGGAHLSPVAIFEPVQMLGAEIRRAHFKSIRWMTDRKERVSYFRGKLRQKNSVEASSVGVLAEEYAGSEEYVGIGSVVEIARSGDVIPTITRVVSNLECRVVVPTACPTCGSGVERVGAFLDCLSDECPAKEAARMVKFLSALGVKGLGQDTLVLYAESGVTLLDFFSDDWDAVIRSKIESNSDVSVNVWAKIASQITG